MALAYVIAICIAGFCGLTDAQMIVLVGAAIIAMLGRISDGIESKEDAD